jgi:uncharacterized protein YbjT (DUF2867 family)
MAHLVAVTGATGDIGGRVVGRLLEAGVRVRALGRDAARLAALAARGAETRVGNLEDRAFLGDAFRGADAVFALVPEDPGASDIHADKGVRVAALDAALRSVGVPHVVALSAVAVTPPSGIGPSRALGELEARLQARGDFSTVVLRAAFLMENLLGAIPLVRAAGIHAGPLRGDVPLAMVAKRDVADAAAALLVAPSFEGHGVRALLGPRDYTHGEVTSILGAAIGRPELPYVQVPMEAFRDAIVGSGASASMAQALVEMFAAFEAGSIQALASRDAASTTPTTLETFARDTFAPMFHRQEAAAAGA